MFKRNRRSSSRLDLLRSVPLFDGVPDEVLERLDGHLEEVALPEGRRLVTEGTKAFETFIVVEGTAQIRVDGEVVGEAGAGEVIGEVALLRSTKRTATVSAKTPMRVLALDASEIDWLFTHEALAERVRDSLSRHLGGPQTSR